MRYSKGIEGGHIMGDCTQEIEHLIAENAKLKQAYFYARNAAAGLTNLCDDNPGTRRCENDLEKAEEIVRDIKIESLVCRSCRKMPMITGARVQHSCTTGGPVVTSVFRGSLEQWKKHNEFIPPAMGPNQ